MKIYAGTLSVSLLVVLGLACEAPTEEEAPQAEDAGSPYSKDANAVDERSADDEPSTETDAAAYEAPDSSDAEDANFVTDGSDASALNDASHPSDAAVPIVDSGVTTIGAYDAYNHRIATPLALAGHTVVSGTTTSRFTATSCVGATGEGSGTCPVGTTNTGYTSISTGSKFICITSADDPFTFSMEVDIATDPQNEEYFCMHPSQHPSPDATWTCLKLDATGQAKADSYDETAHAFVPLFPALQAMETAAKFPLGGFYPGHHVFNYTVTHSADAVSVTLNRYFQGSGLGCGWLGAQNSYAVKLTGTIAAP